MFFLIVIAIIIIVCVAKTSNSGSSEPVPAPVAKQSPVDSTILKNVFSIEETAINLAKNNRSGAFLRLSVFEYKGEGMIEFYHSFYTNNFIDPQDIPSFVNLYASDTTDEEKQIYTEAFLKSFGCSYREWDKLIPYFSTMNLDGRRESVSYITAQKQISIPAESVPLYFNAILAGIREKWPYLQIEVDSGDIDIHI